jgi:glycosyltransferase involved in cell wall biosynthesis
MRVLYDDQVFATQRFGGISRYINEVATATAHQAEVLVSAGMYLNRYLHDNREVNKSGFYVDESKAWRVRDKFNQCWTALQSRRFQPDVVHETYYRASGLHAKRAKVVVTVHDFIHELYPSEAPFSQFHASLKRESLARADAFLAVSVSTLNDLLKIYPWVEEKPHKVIHHGSSYSEPSTSAINQILDATDGHPYILYVGHRKGYKRFKDLIGAYTLIKPSMSSLKVLAFGCGAFSDNEAEEITAAGVSSSDFVYVEGSDDLLNAAYKCASVFCYTSLYEGFGIPILEALSAGCPVVCSDISVFREVGGGGVAYYEAGSATALASELENVLNSRERAGNVKMKSWHDCSSQHLHFYQEMLEV